MVSLKSMFLEKKTTQPIAIFMAGSAGAGKTSFRRKYIDPLGKFVVLNIDDEYEPLLKKAGLPLDFRQYTSPEQLSQAAKAMGRAQQRHKTKYSIALSNLNNLIIDGTGGSSKEISKKKQELESLGYRTMMTLIFVPPDVSLQRNVSRGEQGGRTLMPSIILRTWSSLFSNIKEYKALFGKNLIIYKAYQDEDIVFPNFDPQDPSVKKTFFDPFKVKGKPKSEKEKKASIEKMKALNQQIKTQFSQISTIKFDTEEEIKQKLNQFVNA